MTKPAHVRATAPATRLAVGVSAGRLDEALPAWILWLKALDLWRNWRMALSDEKYRADPNPVRSDEGSVPLQKARIGRGDCLSSRQ